MPVIYGALEVPNPKVQHKALKIIPTIVDIIDYATVKTALFQKLELLYKKSDILTIRINTLICFYSILKFLDQFTIVEKLIPTLRVIKTAEPGVLVSLPVFFFHRIALPRSHSLSYRWRLWESMRKWPRSTLIRRLSPRRSFQIYGSSPCCPP